MAAAFFSLAALCLAEALRPPSSPLQAAPQAAPQALSGEVERGSFVAGVLSAGIASSAAASVAEPSASGISRSVDKEVARKILQIERLNVDSNSNGDKAKHLPQVRVAGDKVECFVPHVMDPVKPHFIEYIWLKDDDTDFIFAAKKFEPTDPSPPTIVAKAKPGASVTPYAYCNLHGLWIGDTEQT
eukprot:CAMPEP_0197388202 /NCGR_PEP_ID=MMETSP1165-20131217/941_1 /TAXON_ID=284809 /ORGANISM="Chrysocystis fragilis, Strain CCMP3189" /LENGTH=185 /DNA_ID=CAMNT_0042913543 /DNA_START=23 /DNA_END=580 /DNA_ORIENTATION=+